MPPLEVSLSTVDAAPTARRAPARSSIAERLGDAVAPWTGRRVAWAGAAWMTAALVEYMIVDRTMWHGRRMARLLAFYGSLALLWTALTPLIGRCTRGGHSAAVTAGRWLLAVAAAGALDAATRRLVLTLEGTALWNPFWSTWLFFIDVTAAQCAAAVVATRLLESHDALVRRARAELTLRAQLARSRLTFLEAQLQPHFLFNALGTVSELARDAPATAARMLRQLATLLRAALDRSGEPVTLAEELETLEPYLDIQRVRFADWLQIEQHVSPGARTARVPRLILQPLVENAIKHGLARRRAKGLVRISARVEDGRLEVSVRDNGVGLGAPPSARTRPGFGLGLPNVRDRLATLYGDDWRLAMDNAADGGAIVVLSIPARHADAPDADDPAGRAGRVADRPRLLDAARRHPIAATVAGWTLWAAAWGLQSRTYLVLRGHADLATPHRLFVTHSTAAVLWMLLTPVVVWLARRVPIAWRGVAWRLAAHATFAAAVALAHALAWRAWLDALLDKRNALTWPDDYVTSLFVNGLTYFILFGVTHYERTARWLRERENTAAALRAALDEARLREATLRARPEELCRTLDELAERVTRDARGTERALSALAERLRRALDEVRETATTRA